MLRFEDRVAIICGGAGGIGLATARLLWEEGATIIIIDVDAERLRSIEGIFSGERCSFIAADLRNSVAAEEAIKYTIDRYGRLDILINIVGGSTLIANPNVDTDELSYDEWDGTIVLNTRPAFICSKSAIPHMKARGYGRIVNLSSIIGRGDSRLSNSAYAASKAAIRAFTRKMATELGPFGITCNATAPSITLTERMVASLAARGRDAPQTTISDIPLRRMSTPEEQAKVIAFLASEDAAFVSGQTIEVTGGQ